MTVPRQMETRKKLRNSAFRGRSDAAWRTAGGEFSKIASIILDMRDDRDLDRKYGFARYFARRREP